MTIDLKALAEPLDAARVRQRTDGRGGSLSYLEAHDVIRTANRIFGYGGWGHTVKDLRLIGQATVHNREQKPGVHVGYLCVVELTVNGCTPVSGIGYGDATEYRESAPVTAHELAAKEAESDALKRALKNYGDQFGLVLYDKDQDRSEHITGTTLASPAPRTTDVPGPTPSNGAGASEKQTAFIRRLMSDRGITDIGAKPEELSKQDASRIIEELKNGTFAPPGGTLEDAFAGAGVDLDIPFAPTTEAVI